MDREGPGDLNNLFAASGRRVADLAPRKQQIWAASGPDQGTATAHVFADLARGGADYFRR